MKRWRTRIELGSWLLVAAALSSACGDDSSGAAAGGTGAGTATGGTAGTGAKDAGGGTTATGGGGADAGGTGGGVPSCGDGAKNGAETDVDCGGTCDKCADGKGCSGPTDCASYVCQAGKCQPPQCTDSAKNGDETDLDCGATCPKCAVCRSCKVDGDCAPGLCEANLCGPTIEVVSAVYAGNCGAPTPVPTIVTACNSKKKCDYVFNYTVDVGFDPAYGCYKDLKVEYKCTGGTTTKTYYESCAPCDPQNTPTQIHLALECKSCVGLGVPPS